MSIFHSQAGASSDPRRECENRYIVWRVKINLKLSIRTVPDFKHFLIIKNFVSIQNA